MSQFQFGLTNLPIDAHRNRRQRSTPALRRPPQNEEVSFSAMSQFQFGLANLSTGAQRNPHPQVDTAPALGRPQQHEEVNFSAMSQFQLGLTNLATDAHRKSHQQVDPTPALGKPQEHEKVEGIPSHMKTHAHLLPSSVPSMMVRRRPPCDLKVDTSKGAMGSKSSSSSEADANPRNLDCSSVAESSPRRNSTPAHLLPSSGPFLLAPRRTACELDLTSQNEAIFSNSSAHIDGNGEDCCADLLSPAPSTTASSSGGLQSCTSVASTSPWSYCGSAARTLMRSGSTPTMAGTGAV